MRYADYSTLKAASKVVFKKVAAADDKPEHIVLEQKKYDSNTGAEIDTKKTEISLIELEKLEKDMLTDKTKLTAELAEVTKMITEIKAL